MKEIIICVDKNDKEIGFIEKMDAHIRGILHRAISVFIFNDNKELLLENIIHLVFGQTHAVLILTKVKKLKMQLIED